MSMKDYLYMKSYMDDVSALQRHGESPVTAIYGNPLYNNVAKFMHNWSNAYRAGDAEKASELINGPMGVFMSVADNAHGAWQMWRASAYNMTNQLILDNQKKANEEQLTAQKQQLDAQNSQQQEETIKQQQNTKYYHQQNTKNSSMLADKNSSGATVSNSLGGDKDNYFDDNEIEQWY